MKVLYISNSRNKCSKTKMQEILFFFFMCAQFGHFGNNILIYGTCGLFIGYILIRILVRNEYKAALYVFQAKYILFILLFTIYSCASYIWASYKEATLDGIPSLIRISGVTFVLLIEVKSIAKIEKYIEWILLAALYMCVKIVIYIPLHGIAYGRFALLTREYTGLHRNTVGHIAAISILLVFFLYVRFKRRFQFVFLPLYLITVFITGSFKAIFIPFVGIIIYYVINLYRDGKIKAKSVITLIIVAVFIGSTLALLLKNNQDFMIRAISIFGKKNTDGSVIVRKALIQKASKLFRTKPVFGWGLYNMPHVDVGFFGVAAKFVERYAHNNWWEILANLGVIGFVLYYLRYYILVKSAVKNDVNVVSKTFSLSFIMTLLIFEYGTVSYNVDFYQYLITLIVCLVNYDNENSNMSIWEDSLVGC